MNRLYCCCLLVSSALLLGVGVDCVEAGPISSTLSLQADSNAGAGTVTDSDTQSQGSTISPLNASVTALAVNGAASVETTGTGVATWTNSNAGQLILSNFGWTTANVSSGSAFLTGGLDFSYTFVADASGTFTLDYSIITAGSNTFGLNGFSYNFSGHNAFLTQGTSGTITETVIVGNTYTLTIGNQANISGGLGTRDAHMSGTFDFSSPAAAVPEPATVTLLGLSGFGLLGYARRNRKQCGV